MDQLTFEQIKQHIAEWIHMDYILPEDIPSIELYMDQITTFMEHRLNGNKRNADDKILTKTMINNYSKNDLLPPSNKKKYSKDHIILLIYIYYLKNFLSITDIQNLLKPLNDNYFHQSSGITLIDIYSHMFALEQEYSIEIQKSIQDIYDTASQQYPDGDDYLKTLSMILLLSYDIYTKKQLVEKMIDSITVKPVTKEERKESSKKKERAAKERTTKERNTKEQSVKERSKSKNRNV